jgi:hypothetical protein
MKNNATQTRTGSIIPTTLLASAFLGFMAVIGFIIVPSNSIQSTSMRLEPLSKVLTLDETFKVAVVVESSVPVNAFAGELFFDTHSLAIQSIDYNTSIADLWAEKPWYSNGDGTVNFIGGTTRKGGFTGTDTLITVTFKAIGQGNGSLFIRDARILQHDGLGSDAPLSKPIDALFTIAPASTTSSSNLLSKEAEGSRYSVVPKAPSTDLNGDGKQTIADVSILLLHMGSTEQQYDLNGDRKVDLKDMAIILSVD